MDGPPGLKDSFPESESFASSAVFVFSGLLISRGSVGPGAAWLGEAWLVAARNGVAMRGKSRQVEASTKGPSSDGSFLLTPI